MENTRIHVMQGDITTQHVDAIVNAANSSLLGGSGVDGAIHRGAGPGLLEECRTLRGCAVGEAKITGGYKLPAKHIIHTVGPVWGLSGGAKEDGLLATCYRNSLVLAVQHQVRSIAFPAISTGAYRFPLDRATRIAIATVKAFLAEDATLERVIFVCFDDKTYRAYADVLGS